MKFWRSVGLVWIGLVLTVNLVHAREVLEFSDEFNEPILDPQDWHIENRPGGGQGRERPDLQYYLPDSLVLNGGKLQITARKADATSLPLTKLPYLSGRIETRRTFLYGRFAFRARLPLGKGLWPVIGLRTVTGIPLRGEIDVVQGFGSTPNIIESALSVWNDGLDPRLYGAFLVVQPKPDRPKFHREGILRVDKLINLTHNLSEEFHLYSVDWKPDHLTWSFDGVPYFTLHDKIPKDPMVLIIRLAVGGAGDGKPDETTIWPQSLDLDYVRVWSEAN